MLEGGGGVGRGLDHLLSIIRTRQSHGLCSSGQNLRTWGQEIFLVGRRIPVLETSLIKSPRIMILCESERQEKFGALNSRPRLCTASSPAGLWS